MPWISGIHDISHIDSSNLITKDMHFHEAYMRFTDFSSVENQVKPVPCDYMYNHALAVYFDKSTSSRISSILGIGKQ